MKQIALLITTLLCAYLNAQNKSVNGQFTFSGKISGQKKGFVHLRYINKDGKRIDDSCALKNGVFYFKGKINKGVDAYFYGKRKSRSVEDPNATDIFLEPNNMKAVFKVNNFKHAKIAGSKSQDDYMFLTLEEDMLNKKWKPFLDNLNEAKEKKETARYDSLRASQIPAYSAENNAVYNKFINAHPNSDVTAYLLWNPSISLDSLKKSYARLTKRVQFSYYGKQLLEYIMKTEAIAIGKPAPNFIQADTAGNLISLNNFNGKYVLLEFWASWCAPCRAENPNLIQAYNQYKEKGFTILGISLNVPNEKEAWLKAIKDDGVLWQQVCDFKSWGGPMINEYNLGGKGIPANFLIDPTGKIVGINLHGDDLNKKLAELLAKN